MVNPLLRRGSRWLNPGMLVLVGLFFLLPFVTVACVPGGYGRSDASGATTYTGLDLATGGRPAVAADKLRPAAQQVDDRLAPQPLALAALAVVLFALVVAIAVTDARVRRAAVTGLSAIGALLLVANQATVQALLVEKVRAQLTRPIPAGHRISDVVQARNGFWLSLLALGGLAVVNAIGWRRAARARSGGYPHALPTPAPGAPTLTDGTLPVPVDPWPTAG
jgi:hypothetical protein